MIIDTHCHYNLEPLLTSNEKEKIQVGWKEKDGYDVFEYVETWEPHLKKAVEAGVKKTIVVGTNFITSSAALDLSEKSPHLFASVGYHPHEYQDIDFTHSYDEHESDILTDMEELSFIVNKKVVAVGETGLDYFRLPESDAEAEIIKKLQKKSFEEQIELAKHHNLPLICHVRDQEVIEEKKEGNAYWDALDILQKLDVKKFVLHCASGPLSYIKQAVEMGGYFGFDGNISYPNAEHIRDIFSIVPTDRRVVETDAPYLPPQSYRGKTCEPWMIAETVEYIEQTFKVDKSSFYENSLRLFHLN